MTVSTSRAARQQRIVEILASTPVRSQTELLDLLAADGIEVTQATLSRDLVDVGAERVRRRQEPRVRRTGRRRRPHPARRAAAAFEARLARVAQELLVAPSARQPGHPAHPAGRGATSSPRPSTTPGLEGVLGTIAGDDTIMVVDRRRAERSAELRRAACWPARHPPRDP